MTKHADTVDELYDTFIAINKDCSMAVPFDDVEYYAMQIENIYDYSPRYALQLAKAVNAWHNLQNA